MELNEILRHLAENRFETASVLLFVVGLAGMLFNRNLLYTAVTRARKCVAIIGDEHTVEEMIRNEREQAEHERQMEANAQKIQHEEEMRRMFQNMTAEQIVAANPDITPEAAAATMKVPASI